MSIPGMECGRIPVCPDGLAKLLSMPEEFEDQERYEERLREDEESLREESLRARSEQAITDLAQALLDSQMLENALAAAFGAREKAVEAQQAAMAALNLPSAGDVERVERRLRSFSQRLEDVEDQLDALAREVGQIRRDLAADRPGEPRKPVEVKD
jgi:chromosome segregation ATPase